MKKLSFFILIFLSSFCRAQNNAYSFEQIDSLIAIAKQEENNEKVAVLLQAGIDKAKKELGTQDSVYALRLHKLGLFHLRQNQQDLAEPLLIAAKMGYEKTLGKNNPKYIQILDNLAILYLQNGNYSLAEPLFLEAKNITTKVLGKEDPSYSNILSNLAALYFYMGKFDLAQELALELKTIVEKQFGKEDPRYFRVLSNLATLYMSSYKYKLAEPLLLSVKSNYAKQVGKENSDYLECIYNLSLLYESTEQYSLAEPLVQEGIKIYAQLYGRENARYGELLNGLARLYFKMNKTALAWEYLLNAIQIYSGLEMSSQVSKAWADSLGQADYPSHEHFDKMVQALDIIYELLEKEKQVIVSDLAMLLIKKNRAKYSNDQDKLRMLSQSHDWMLKSLKAINIKTQTDKAFEIAELNKAGLLLEASKASESYQFGGLPEPLIAEEKKLSSQYAELEAKLLEKRPEKEKEELRAEINQVNLLINAFKQKIEKEYPKYAALKYQQNSIKTAEIQTLLDKKTALLEYVIGDSVLYIFYLDQQHAYLTQQFIDKKELKKRIKNLHAALSTYNPKDANKSYRDYTENAYWCYQQLLAPVLSDAKGIQQLIIISDGELGHLPFETFLVEKAPEKLRSYASLHYLLNDYALSYNYSAAIWKENKINPKNKNNGQLLAMAANYAGNTESLKASARSPTYQRMRSVLSPLPAARQEVESLQKSLQGFFAFDSLATEQAFKEKAGDYGIIHLAMHGLLDNKNPILSSLAFTEDGDSSEDNFLQAFEISKMQLNADLVVLSACETGYGKFEKGNGTASLARAFMYAGVPAMVVSLWQVNDISTSAIMQLFYKNLAKGMDKAEALRQAKLDFIRLVDDPNAAHPSFWAAFVLLGDARPVALAANQGWMAYLPWLGGGLLLLAGIALIWAKRRTKKQRQL